MGALISTIGTRYIVGGLNRAFSPPRIRHIRNQHPIADPANQTIAEYFNPAHPGGDLLWLTQTIRHSHSSRPNNECFLPEDERRSPKAVPRWLYFLTSTNPNVLTSANHVAIRNLIWKGLNDQTGGNPTYERIEFDAVDAKQDAGGGLGQHVIWSDEVDDHGRTYMKIILVTAPIDPAGTPGSLPSLDKQPSP